MSDPATITLPTGEVADVPPAFWIAFDVAVENSCGIEDPAEARAAFGRELLTHLFALDLILVPRGRSHSTQTVSVDTYTLMLSAKHAAEARVHQAVAAFEAGPQRGELHAEFHAAVLALTGHAPLPGVGRIAGVDQRLRELRAALLGVDVDQAAADLPAVTLEGDAA